MDRLSKKPELSLGFTPGLPNVVMIGVDPLTPETFNPVTATEETERAQAEVNQRGYEDDMEQLIEQAGLMAEGGEG